MPRLHFSLPIRVSSLSHLCGDAASSRVKTLFTTRQDAASPLFASYPRLLDVTSLWRRGFQPRQNPLYNAARCRVSIIRFLSASPRCHISLETRLPAASKPSLQRGKMPRLHYSLPIRDSSLSHLCGDAASSRVKTLFTTRQDAASPIILFAGICLHLDFARAGAAYGGAHFTGSFMISNMTCVSSL